jgi:hypothetical protein
MIKHEIKTCPHCKASFECKSGDIINCQCESIILSTEQREYISQRYDDCLCANCLAELRQCYNNWQHQQNIQAITRHH